MKYHECLDGIYGALRIHQDLAQEKGLAVSHNRVARLMRAADWQGLYVILG